MKKSKKIKGVAVGVAAVALATSAVAVGTKTESNAAFYFKRVKLSQCDIKLEETKFDWTGNAICPKVTVNYDGKTLVEGQEYTIKYQDNVDAGVGKVVVEGTGKEFRGSKTLFFTIKGININDECTIKVVGHSLLNNLTFDDELYLYRGEELVDPSNYEVSIVRKKDKCEGIGVFDLPLVNHYIITTQYFVKGKGQYEGIRVYEEKGTFKMLSSETFGLIGRLVTGQFGVEDGGETAAIENVDEGTEILDENVTLIYDYEE